MFFSGLKGKNRATIFLVILNISVYIIVNINFGPLLLETLAQINYFIAEKGQLYRLFTSMVVHANIFHLVSNMGFLLIFGTAAEEFYGSHKTVFIYFISGFIGNIFSFILLPYNTISLGSSGCVFGLIGAYFSGYSEFDRKFILYSVIIVLIFAGVSAGVHVNSWAHLTGGIGGVIFGRIFIADKNKPGKIDENGTEKYYDIEGTPFDEIDDY